MKTGFFFTVLLLGAHLTVAADKTSVVPPPRQAPVRGAVTAVRPTTAFRQPPAARPQHGALAALGGTASAPRNSITPLNGTAIKRKP
jgi:hypothetical protein